MENKILNLTQHEPTNDQIEAGVVNINPEIKKELTTLLNFTSLPSKEEVEIRASKIAAITTPELVWIENFKPITPPKPVRYANTLKDLEDFYISPEELCKDYEVRECVVKPPQTTPRYFSDEIPFAYLLAKRTYSLTK